LKSGIFKVTQTLKLNTVVANVQCYLFLLFCFYLSNYDGTIENMPYDPSERGWFRGAVENKVSMTEPYEDADTDQWMCTFTLKLKSKFQYRFTFLTKIDSSFTKIIFSRKLERYW
jgi:hypothetical protein